MNEENKDLELKDEIVEQEEAIDISTSEDVKTESSSEVSIELDEESKAKSRGWDPSKGDKTAREFNLIGEMIDLKKELGKRDKMIEEIYKYQQSVIQEHKQRARLELEARLKEARELGDVEGVEQLAKEKLNLEIKEQQDIQQRSANEQLTALNAFVNRNQHWFNDRYPELKVRCQEIEAILRPTCKSWDEVAEKVEKQVKMEMQTDPKYAHLVSDNTVSRPSFSPTKSSANRGTVEVEESDTKLYSKLSSNERAMYEVANRIAKKVGEKISVKEFVLKLNEDKEV